MAITLFRVDEDTVDSAGDTYTLDDIPDSEKLVFDGDSEKINFVTNYQVSLGRKRTDNPTPYREETAKPDTGFGGNTYTLNLIFVEEGGRSPAVATLRNWEVQGNAIRIKFPHGRIGIRNDHSPEFDIDPSNDVGLKIEQFAIIHGFGAERHVRRGILTLELSGGPAVEVDVPNTPTITGIGSNPVANDFSDTVQSDEVSMSWDLAHLMHISDDDQANNTLTVSIISGPNHGTATVSGVTISYTLPDPDVTVDTTDVIVYRVTDDDGNFADGRITINIEV